MGVISKYQNRFAKDIAKFLKMIVSVKVQEKKKVKDLNEMVPIENFETFEEYNEYADYITQLEYNKLYNPNYNEYKNKIKFESDLGELWYDAVEYIVFENIRRIFIKEGIN